MKQILTILLLMISIPAIQAMVFETTSYSIKVEHNCPENCVSCDQLQFSVTNKIDKSSFEIKGKTNHSTGVDGCPSQFWGYSFKTTGGDNFFITNQDKLVVTDSKGQEILSESGKWKPQRRDSGSANGSATPTITKPTPKW